MALTRSVIFVLIVLLFSCNKEKIEVPVDGEYTGQLVEIISNTQTGLTTVDTVVTEIYLEIEDSEFVRFDSLGNQLCSGEIVVDKNEINFISNGCDCFCDCSPFVDCRGDLMLGNYMFEYENCALSMWGNTLSSVNGPNEQSEWFREATYELVRKH